ncbi:hypothetical protein ES705_17759 [subsurface metagenome]
MKNTTVNRRGFLQKSAILGVTSMFAPGLISTLEAIPTPRMVTDDISIAQWSLVQEIKKGKWKTMDFPKIAREDFDINGIEFVNTLI